VTTPARTLLDLATSLTRRQLERALDQSEILRLFDLSSFDALMASHAGERGVAALRAALDRHTAGTTLTKSELEERFLALCDDAALARPRVNSHVEGLEVDFAWPQHRLIVETDGWRYHRTRAQFENDRRRDAALARAGYHTLRFSHHQITTAPDEVVRTLRAGSAGSPPDPGGPR